MVDAATSSLEEQMESFIAYMRRVRRASENTVQAYIRDLYKFLDYAATIDLKNYNNLTQNDVQVYKDQLCDAGLSPASVSRSLSALRSMYQYLLSNSVVDQNPARLVHNDRFEKRGPHILTGKEIDLLLAQPSTDDSKGKRDKAMLELIYATGMKVTELISLNVDDINIPLSVVRCSKNKKERIIPLYPLAVSALSVYLESARKTLVADQTEVALFVNVAGDRMTRQGFWKILKSYAASAKISKDITPHMLRNSFAAHLLENGADIHEIQEILGHVDISSTQRYAHLIKAKVENSYIKFHPRA